jgi:hypothetical protein
MTKEATMPAPSRPYTELGDLGSVGQLMVRENTSGLGAPATFVVGNPNGSIVGPIHQLAVDRATGIVYQNTDGATAWAPFAPGATVVQTSISAITADAYQQVFAKAPPILLIAALRNDDAVNTLEASLALTDLFGTGGVGAGALAPGAVTQFGTFSPADNLGGIYPPLSAWALSVRSFVAGQPAAYTLKLMLVS